MNRLKKLSAVTLILISCVTPLGIGVAVALNPLGRHPPDEDEWVAVASLRDLPMSSAPRRVPVLVTRRDAWTTLPDRLVGEVFLRRTGEHEVAVLRTTYRLCTSVEFNPATQEFEVPCWSGIHFDMTGRRLHPNAEWGNLRQARFRLEGDTVFVSVPDVTRIDG